MITIRSVIKHAEVKYVHLCVHIHKLTDVCHVHKSTQVDADDLFYVQISIYDTSWKAYDLVIPFKQSPKNLLIGFCWRQ